MKNLYILFICLFSLNFGTLQAQNTFDCMCTEEYDPVCGADGITYGNFCFSTCENIEISYFGACIEQPISATAGEIYSTTINLGLDTSPVDGPYLFLWSAPDWAEAAVSSYDPNNTLAMNDNILYIDGTPTSNDIGANYFVIYAQSAWTGDYSVYDTIIVNVISADDCYCYMMYSPVCGEDGQTYGNICEAGCEDVAIAYEGECEEITPCLGDFDIIEQEYIAGFAGMMLHLQVQNTGSDLSTTMASVILDNSCASNDIFTFDTWASGDIVNMYFNYSCMSMIPYIEPFEAILVLSGTTNCAQDISFVFDPQGNNSTGCTDSDGIFYTEGSSWNIDDCTFCSCFNGEILCAIADCAMPACDDPIYIEGQCCPICEEEILGCTNSQAINYNPEANIDDESCVLDPNQETCTYNGETLQLGETITVNGELCTCLGYIINDWGINSGAQMFCVPLTDTLGCSSSIGDFYPLGAFMEGECETCQCVDQGIIANNPYWVCEEIADCNACSQMECEPGFYCENGECLPEIDLMGCTADNGEVYPFGFVMEGECEICFCEQSLIAIYPPEFYWNCEEIADCNTCSQMDCEPGFYCENGECLPETDLMGCTADNGEVYSVGYTMEGECETCICTPSMLMILPPMPPSWNCIEIVDCEEPQDCETVYMNMSSSYYSWYPGMTYSIVDANGTVIASGTNDEESSTDTLCLPSSCNYQVMMEGISPYGGCELAIWSLLSDSGEELATNISCDEYWQNSNMTYYVDFEIGCSSDCECPLDIWNPVCAENGETYAYNCFPECLDLDYEMGECTTLPDSTCICPMNYNPVCGSDGITYSNECFAECADVNFYEGACLPTSFCDAIEVETETIYTDNGDVQLNITVYNNSTNDINYPVFNLETANDYLTIEPIFENAYWLGAGESTTNSYSLTDGGNAAALVEGAYYVSQLNQNAACAYPISFTYEPIWSGIGCYANGAFYPMGSTLTGDCEICYCAEVGELTVMPTWECTDIEDCETDDPCNLIDCADGYECVNGDCISIEPQEYGCTEGNQWYEFGSVIDQECNTCSCTPGFNPNAEGFWMCTMMPCEEEYGCELDGELYEFGTSLEQGCNTCYCEAGFNPNANGIWSCTEMACSGCTDQNALNWDVFADWDDESCEYETDPIPNWDYLNTGSNHTLVLAEDMLVELDGTSLEAGDWIGVFYTLNGEFISGGYTVWDGGTSVIPAQGDDTTTDIQDGFNSYQEFQWLVWDASANTTYSMHATYDTTMPNQEQYATNGISAILTLTAQPLISEQELQLVEGWNLFSTYMVAEVMDAEELFASFVEDVVIVKNYLGLAYLPDYNFNGVGDLLPGQGYQAKLNNANNLTIVGDYLTPEENPIDLANGWNLIAYLRTEPADIIAVFEDIQELVIVKDNIGMAYLPEYGFNGIGNMVSGQAYQIKVLLEQQLQYLANNQSYRLEMTAVENNLQHYKTPQNTGSNMSLVIEATELESLLSFGDEVAVYSNSNRLVGAFVYQEQNIVIPVYGNDDYFKEQNGLLTNEALTLKYWSNEKGEEIPLNINWDSSTGLYEQNSIQVASIENANSAFSKIDFEITPNPATHSAALNFDLREKSQVEIQVFNILGDLVFNKGTIEFNKGENRVNLNVADYAVGTYLIKLQTNSSVYTKRLLVQ
tara:strand:- start:226 stop:5196 length:4971 start_codon:yes stop_codon:yes gene_type:complete